VRPCDNRHEESDPRFDQENHDPTEFDRIAFAMRALRRLGPGG
jgi:hypothetical protein